ncbi:hypothetical protein CR513_18989, partial [Mucuna pruriens]
MHDLHERHFQAIERILHYMKACLSKGLLFRREGLAIDRRPPPIIKLSFDMIEIDKCFIKEKFDGGLIITRHIPTRLQVADVFTKGFPRARFQDIVGKLEIIDIHFQT